jgi:hypothetical protein
VDRAGSAVSGISKANSLYYEDHMKERSIFWGRMLNSIALKKLCNYLYKINRSNSKALRVTGRGDPYVIPVR